MVFYFTATGNSLYVAKELDEHRISIAQAVHDTAKVYHADRIGIVYPVFGCEMPELVREFLAESRFDANYFFIILTYGNRRGKAAELAEAYAEQSGIHPDYINAVRMADNFLPGFDMEEQRQLDKKVDEQLFHIKTDIAGNKKYIVPSTERDRAMHREFLSRLETKEFQEFYEITEDCIGCGICTKVCPKKCFHLEGQKSVWDPRPCIRCMACIHACPMLAIRLKIPEKNPRARYRNENISICEIIAANNQWTEADGG